MALRGFDDWIQFDIPFHKDIQNLTEYMRNINRIKNETRTDIQVVEVVRIKGNEKDVEEARRRVSGLNTILEQELKLDHTREMNQTVQNLQNKILETEREMSPMIERIQNLKAEFQKKLQGIKNNFEDNTKNFISKEDFQCKIEEMKNALQENITEQLGKKDTAHMLSIQARFQYRVCNLSKLKDEKFSRSCYIQNLPWKMSFTLSPYGQEQNKSFDFFLHCNTDSKSKTWSCQASFELRLLSQKEGGKPFLRKSQEERIFCHESNCWGFGKFISWSEVMDPEKGYIKDDTIVIEASVSAKAPSFC